MFIMSCLVILVLVFEFLILVCSFPIIVKLLDWGEDGMSTTAETTALRASFQQEVAVWHKLDHPNVTKVRTMLSTSSYCFYG